jgi:hypothetical protein
MNIPGWANTLRRTLAESGRSLRDVAIEADVCPSVVQKFVVGTCDLKLATAERIGRVLNLRLVETAARPKPKRAKG